MLRTLIACAAALILAGTATAQSAPTELEQLFSKHPQAMRDAEDVYRSMQNLATGATPDGVGANGIDLGSMVDTQDMTAASAMERARMPQILTFVSSSMPPASVRAAAEQARAAGGVLVLRGLVNNSIRATADWMVEVFGDKVGENGAIVDPRLFAAFGVDVVPTVVVASDGPVMCEADPDCPALPAYDRVLGDVTLQYALELVQGSNGPGASVARAGLARLEKPRD